MMNSVIDSSSTVTASMQSLPTPAQRFRIAGNERALLVGRTGSGKSTLARALLAEYDHVFVIDAKGDLELLNAIVLTSPDKVSELEFSHRRALSDPVIYRPEPQYWDYRVYDRVFHWAYLAQNLTVYVDEISAVMGDGYNVPQWYRALLTRGRALGIRMLSGTQRPSGIPLNVLSETDHVFLFELLLRDDRRRMAEIMGERVLSDDLLAEHAFWYYDVRRAVLTQHVLEKGGLMQNGC